MDTLAEDDLVPVSKLGVTIGGAQEAALIKALAVRAEERYRSVEEFQFALIGTEPAKAVAETVPMREKRVIPSVIKGLAADVFTLYFIDYERGSIPLASLPIGARVIDPTWGWNYRPGNNYTGSGEKKTVIWIVVAKDHYDGLPTHVTLLAEELIGKFTFDNRKSMFSMVSGTNHWGDSGTGNADRGLRPWMNSVGIHRNVGFYLSFSKSFSSAVSATKVPNRDWKHGVTYNSTDKVFIPSITELGGSAHSFTHQIGKSYPYFHGAVDTKRATGVGSKKWWYWTRSPASGLSSTVRIVYYTGEFINLYVANYDCRAVRPALNLKSES